MTVPTSVPPHENLADTVHGSFISIWRDKLCFHQQVVNFVVTVPDLHLYPPMKIWRTLILFTVVSVVLFGAINFVYINKSSTITVRNSNKQYHQVLTLEQVENLSRLRTRKVKIDGYKTAVESGKIPSSWPALPEDALSTAHIFTEPLMSCEGAAMANKLIFIHIFKTAGSTVREFFNRYAENCQRGWIAVTSCADINPHSIGNGNVEHWQDRRQKYIGGQNGCRIVDQVSRSASLEVKIEMAVPDVFVRKNADILGGHLSLGINPWAIRKDLTVTYLTFIRDTQMKFVSGYLYSDQQNNGGRVLSDLQYANKIKSRVRDLRRQNKYYADGFTGLSKYLLRPEQKVFMAKTRGESAPMSVMKDIIKQNLIDLNVVIGCVERMGESMRMIQELIDPEETQLELFEEFGLTGKDTVLNDSSTRKGGTTESVLSILLADVDFALELREFLKYDEEVTQFALQLHFKQVNELDSMKMAKKA